MSAQKAKYSGVMGKIMSNEKVAKALNQSKERKEFYGILKNAAEGGVSKNELREISDRLAHGHDTRTISQKEGRLIAEGLHEEFYADRKKYKLSRPDFSKNTRLGSSEAASVSKNTASPAEKATMTPVKMATIMNRIRTNSGSLSEGTEDGQPKGNFSQALAAMRKNKRD